VTLEFSTDTPCAAAVIPAMDKMHAELTAAVENINYSPALRAALSLGKNLLDKYYSLSDDSEVYRIATGTCIMNHDFIMIHSKSNYVSLVLHPKYKLKYFEKQGWEDEWVKTAKEMVREEFKRSYEEYRPHKPSISSLSSKRKVSIHGFFFFHYFKSLPVPRWHLGELVIKL
jgi:hypothetical protein